MEWKIWAFDGASEDGTAWIVKEYAAGRGERVRYLLVRADGWSWE